MKASLSGMAASTASLRTADISCSTRLPGCVCLWSVWIDYNGTVLSVAIADNSTVRPPNLIDYPIDIASILGGQPAYVGFTGPTGNGLEYHRVAHWVFQPGQ